jgi:peptidoglycan biosynthesis protein MviN/MurJ (putative lipid II flippase)
MRSFFFGDAMSRLHTLIINICLVFALGIPLRDIDTFREAGIGTMIGYVAWWLLSIPFCVFGLFQAKKRREQRMLVRTFS